MFKNIIRYSLFIILFPALYSCTDTHKALNNNEVYAKIIDCLFDTLPSIYGRDFTIELRSDRIPDFAKEWVDGMIYYKNPNSIDSILERLLKQDYDSIDFNKLNLSQKTRYTIENSNKNSEEVFYVYIFIIQIDPELNRAYCISGTYISEKTTWAGSSGYTKVDFFEKKQDKWHLTRREEMGYW